MLRNKLHNPYVQSPRSEIIICKKLLRLHLLTLNMSLSSAWMFKILQLGVFPVFDSVDGDPLF